MPDVVTYAGTGITYKNGTSVVWASKLGNTKVINPRIEHNVVTQESGILASRFDDCGPSGNYYFT